jgi:phage tail sheath protein FI
MAEYLSPGVYVEEIDAGPKPIEGVSTSTAGAAGVTLSGPTHGKPELVTSFADFVRKFGGFIPDPDEGLYNKWANNPVDGGRWWQFPLAVKGFFDNGGQRLYVKRVISGSATAAAADFGTGLASEIVADAAAEATMTYAIRGYFENEGEVAHVIRLCHPSAEKAAVEWKLGELDDEGQWTANSPSAFNYASYRIEANSPGDWANNTTVTVRCRLRGASGLPEVDLAVVSPGEPNEYFTALSPDTFAEEVAVRSQLIRVIPGGQAARGCSRTAGPHALNWDLTLNGGRDADSDHTPGKPEYLEAIRKLGDEGEVALVAVPGLFDDVGDAEDQNEILTALVEQAEQLRDRLVLIDVRTDAEDTGQEGLAIRQVGRTLDWVEGLRLNTDDNSTRAAAVYHPRLSVPDPLGGIRRPLRNVPPSGHVAGVISRLDRQRGAHHTPANAPVFEAVDVTQQFDPTEQARFNASGVNLLRCFAGKGLQVWGGRTLNIEPERRFIAHRRLIHRLVRAIRRVAEPLVFDINGPEMWLALVRAITTVLLEAWRAGALKGEQPDEGFRVRCDEELNPPEEQDLGRVNCEIEVAPATPMEFILLRVSLSGDGKLEVFEP